MRVHRGPAAGKRLRPLSFVSPAVALTGIPSPDRGPAATERRGGKGPRGDGKGSDTARKTGCRHFGGIWSVDLGEHFLTLAACFVHIDRCAQSHARLCGVSDRIAQDWSTLALFRDDR